MRISTRGQYSLEALLFLAQLPEGEFASIKNISEKTGISSGYLEQLFIPLKKKGIIKGIRGALGGYYIASPLNEVSVSDVLYAVEGTLEPVQCLKSKKCPAETDCISRQTWGVLYKEINNITQNLTFEDLVKALASMALVGGGNSL